MRKRGGKEWREGVEGGTLFQLSNHLKYAMVINIVEILLKVLPNAVAKLPLHQGRRQFFAAADTKSSRSREGNEVGSGDKPW